MVQRFSTFPNHAHQLKTNFQALKFVLSFLYLKRKIRIFVYLTWPYFISIIARMNVFDNQVPFKEWTEQVRHLVMHFFFVHRLAYYSQWILQSNPRKDFLTIPSSKGVVFFFRWKFTFRIKISKKEWVSENGGIFYPALNFLGKKKYK